MEYLSYLFIFAFQLLGMLFNVMQHIGQLRKAYPSHKPGELVAVFWQEDWNTMAVSVAVVATQLLVHVVLFVYYPEITKGNYFYAISFALAIVLGYAGQNLVYKFLGTAANKLEEKGQAIIEKI